jgi:glycosyltransferase involved in cell wall biosynthesis
MTPVLVSYVVTVFNKEDTIAKTAASLLNQSGDFNAEYIFVDDASTDRSVSILEELGDPRIRIVRNTDNKGPSIRLNQGALEAKGEYLQFIDADDILVRGATAEMLRILQTEEAEVIYGKWKHFSHLQGELLDEELEPNLPYVVSEDPLRYVLTHRNIVRMVLMTTLECFRSSGGCDETIFIQDESLPLRLAWKATRFIDFSGKVVIVSQSSIGNLSNNADQIYHDGFHACRNALIEMSDIDDALKRLIRKKALSIAWKYYYRELGGSHFSLIFCDYLWSRIISGDPGDSRISSLSCLFSDGDEVRRPAAGPVDGFVDGIFVVNLDARTERWTQFQEGISSWLGAFGKTPVRFSAVSGVDLKGFDKAPWFRDRIKEQRKKSWAGKAGCILSHRNAIRHAHEQGWRNVLIVEDDAYLTDEMMRAWKSGLSDVVKSLPYDWATVYLYTANPITPCRIVDEKAGIRLIESMGAFGTVAYLVNGRIFGNILSRLPDENHIWSWVARHKAIDLWFSQNLRRFGKIFAVAPSLVNHRVGPSDITMTPESEWTFSGDMEDLVYTNSRRLYAVKKKIRDLKCRCHEVFSCLRALAKRLRGL